MRTSGRRWRWGAPACAALIVLAGLNACGGSDPDPSPDPQPPTTNAVGGLPADERPTASGAYQKTVRLEVPPYYGIAPALQIRYDSRAGDGWLGVGWRMDGLSVVHRLGPGKGAPTYSATDTFFVDGAELSRCQAGMTAPSCAHAVGAPLVAYAARSDDYRRYAYDPGPPGGAWQVWAKDGTKFTYRPRTGQPADPSAWDLAQVEDTTGHVVGYTYQSEPPQGGSSGEAYPSRISFGGMAVEFHYQPRADPLTSGTGRGMVTSSRLMRTVDVKAGADRVRVYRFSYRNAPRSGRSTLVEVRQFGRDAQLDGAGDVANPGTTPSLPPTTFEMEGANSTTWGLVEASSDQWGLPVDGGPLLPVLNGVAFTVTDPFYRLRPSNLGDVDGDGRTDWVQATADLTDDTPRRHTKVLITAALAGRTAPIYTQEELAWPYGNALIKSTMMGDVDADGRSDLIFVLTDNRIPGEDHSLAAYFLTLAVARSSGDGHFTWTTSAATGTSWETREATYNRATHCALGDVDGDTQQDVLCSYTLADGTHFLGTATSLGDGTFAVRQEPTPFAVQGETRLLAVGDTNGDGFSDPMFLDFPHCPPGQPNCTVKYDMVTALSGGSSYATFERQGTPWDRGNPTFFAADINGDGKDDYVALKSITAPTDPGAIQTAYRGFEGAWVLRQTPVPAVLNQVPNSVSVGDANGDGRSDLLVISRQQPGRPGCRADLTGTHLNLHRVLARDNGTFILPSSWEDCSRSREAAIGWADVGYTPVEPQAADLDGDRTADFLIAVSRDGETFTTLREDLSGPSTVDVRNMRRAEVNGDGHSDWMFVRNSVTGPLVTAMVATESGFGARGQSPTPGTEHFTVQDGWRVGDIDADGTDDLVYLDYVTTPHRLQIGSWRSGRTQWTQTTVDAFAGLGERHRNTTSWQLADINGDGRSDLLYVDRSDDGAGLAAWSLISRGDGTWTEVANKALPQWNARATNRRIADVNGDGRADLQYFTGTTSEVRVHTLLGVGDGTWSTAPTALATWARKAGDGLTVSDHRSWWAADVNGDGYSDVMTLAPSVRDGKQTFELRVLTLLGHGDGGYTGVDSPQPAGTVTGDMLQWRTANASPDGRTDLVHIRVAPPGILVTSLTWSHGGRWFLSSPETLMSETTRTTVGNRFLPGDTNGDGEDDFTRFDLLSTGMRLVTIRASFDRDVLRRMRAPDGSITSVEYGTRGTGWATTGQCHLPVGTQPVNVREIRVTAGYGAAGGKATYEYDCPVWSYRHRTFLGWRDAISHRPATTALPASSERHRFALTDECFSQAGYSEIADGQGFVIAKKITAPVPPGAAAPYTCNLAVYVDQVTIGAGQAINAYTYFSHDTFGNVTAVLEHGSDPNGGDDDRTTTIVYRPATGPYIVGLPHQRVLSEGKPAVGKRYTYYCYDGDNGTAQASCTGTISRGQMTAKKVVNPNGWYDTTVYHFDGYGNTDRIVDADGRETTFTFDTAYHRFPERVCDPVARCTTMAWDAGLGRATSVTDPGKVRTETRYDVFGRLWQVLPDGRGKTEYAYPDTGDPTKQRVRVTVEDGTDDGLWTETYLDGRGRPYRTVREGPTAGSAEVQDTVYADAGTAVAQMSLWHPAGEAAVLEDYTYDTLSRRLTHRHADETQESWSYDNDAARTIERHTNEVGHTTTTYRDAYGRTVESRQPSDAGTMTTTYAHDATHQLTGITEPAVSSTTDIQRDARGDLRSVTNPDGGTTTFEDYTRSGEARRIVDANGRWTRLTYDSAGRLESKTAPSYREMHVYYDEAGHGNSMGQITSVTDTVAFGCPFKTGFGGYVTKEMIYDAYGRIAETKQCVDGKSVRFAYTYDTVGRVRTMTYPDAETVTYDYDSAGRIKSVSGYVDEIQYDAAGQVTTLQLPNGVTQTYHYDPRRKWLDRVEATAGGTALFDLSYTRYPDGMPKTTSSATNTANLALTYDPAGQLTGVTGDVGQQIGYDLTGNITSNSEVGAYLYDGRCGVPAKTITCPHAAKKVGTTELVYDNAGGLTAVVAGGAMFPHLKSVQWNEDMLPVAFTDVSGTPTTMRYDENGRRVYRNRSGNITLYFDPYAEISYAAGTPGMQTTQFYYAGNLLLAKKTAAGKTWFHSDELGSTRATTDATGKLVARFDYGPYGRPVGNPPSGAAPDDRRFAGHRFDADNDLIYMGARWYAPSIGRFISPDPIIASTYRPIAPNRYAYAYNRPASMVDPAGLDSFGLGVEQQLASPAGSLPDLFSLHGLAGQAASPMPAGTPLIAAPASSASETAGTAGAPTATLTSSLLPDGTFEITPLPPRTVSPAQYAQNLVSMFKMALAPFRLVGMAVGGQLEINANGCGIFCFLIGDAALGYLMTPAGPSDWFFGDIHIFGSVGGAILGLTPGPAEGIDYLAPSSHSPGWQWALGLSAGAGISSSAFVTQAATPEAFSGFGRAATGSYAIFSGFRGENSAGQATYGVGLGLSVGLGVNVFNNYTVVSPGIWPSWMPTIPYR